MGSCSNEADVERLLWLKMVTLIKISVSFFKLLMTLCIFFLQVSCCCSQPYYVCEAMSFSGKFHFDIV